MQQTNQQINEDYCIFFQELLGKGSYGNVFGAKQISTNQTICVKVIRITNENEKLLDREIEILKKLKEFNNPHLIKIFDIIKQNNSILIYMERCKQTLGDYIAKNKQQKQLLPLLEIINIAKQIIFGYRDLYSHNIIHRDIKPENLLIGTDNKIKICDFGFGKILKFDSLLTQTIIGTPLYVSPQALMTGIYSSKTDIYSFGLLLYFLIFQESYYKVQNLDQLIQKIAVLDEEFSFPQIKNLGNEQDSALLQYILNGCIKYHEKDRFNWEQLFNIFNQITIGRLRSQQNLEEVNPIQNLSQTSQRNFYSEEQTQQHYKTTQKSNQKPPKRQNTDYVNPFKISNLQQHFSKQQSSQERQNKSQEHNLPKTRDTPISNLRVAQTPQRTNNKCQINQATEAICRKERNHSLEKEAKTKNTQFIIKLQQKKQSRLDNDSCLKSNLAKKESTDSEQIKEENQFENRIVKQKTLQNRNLDQNKQLLQINYFRQQNQSLDAENTNFQHKDIVFQQNNEKQIAMLQQIIKGIFAKVQLAENLAFSSSKLAQIMDHRSHLFRYLLINYQQAMLQNIYSINNNEKNLLLYPLQNQLIEFIDPINYSLENKIKQKLSNLQELIQKLNLKNQLITQQIDYVLQDKEKYSVEDIDELIQTNKIKYNYGSIVESYGNHYHKFLQENNYDLSKIKSEELIRFLGYSTKFIQSESLYSVENLKRINSEEIHKLSEDSQILEQFIKENCKKNLKF